MTASPRIAPDRRRRLAAVALFSTTTAGALLGTAGTAGAETPDGQAIVDAAAAQAGDPYSHGSEGPDSFDCSGLTQYAHELVGVEIPRTSSGQAAELPEVSRSEAQPGDVIFMHDSGGDVYHAGIYAGDGEMWAPLTPVTRSGCRTSGVTPTRSAAPGDRRRGELTPAVGPPGRGRVDAGGARGLTPGGRAEKPARPRARGPGRKLAWSFHR